MRLSLLVGICRGTFKMLSDNSPLYKKYCYWCSEAEYKVNCRMDTVVHNMIKYPDVFGEAIFKIDYVPSYCPYHLEVVLENQKC